MIKILVVEDHPVMRPTLRDLFQLEGYDVITAIHGRDALEKLSGAHVDLVITDFMMPKMDGLVLLKSLRSDPRYADLPILMFTANANPELQSKAIAAGVSGFLIRPITVQELLETVEQLLPVLQEHA